MSKKEYPAKLTTGYYRVREVWEDEASQFGAYRLLANAKAKCDENPGSRVFDNDGNVIYPEEAVPDTGADESEEKAVVDDIPEDKPETTPPVEDTPAEKEAEDEVDENEFPTAEELPATIAYGKLNTVVPGDNLWKIAEKELGSGSRCADICVLNGLTSNAIRVGMKLLIP